MVLTSREKKQIAFESTQEYEKYGIEDPRLVMVDNQIYFTYVVLSDYVSKQPVGLTALARNC